MPVQFHLELFRPHQEAAELVRSLRPMPRAVFSRLLPELRARALAVSGIEGLRTLRRIRETIEDFARGQTEEGAPVTWDQARQRLAEQLEAALTEADVAETRATLLLRSQAFLAYQAANWRTAQEDEDVTHLQYLATEDERVRDSHLALNGIILPKDDPFWDKHYPPWEWGCRCRVRPLNIEQVETERARDRRRKPEDQLVLEGARLEQLRQGRIVRGELRDRTGRVVGAGTHDVTAPSDGPEGTRAWQWHPDNLRLSLDELRQRYADDPLSFQAFEDWAARQEIEPGVTVLDWLRSA